LIHDIGFGVIVAWKGIESNIPKGWVLCDGKNDTPDLREKFIVGVGGAYAANDTGGSTSHNHTVSVDPHNHDAPPGGRGLAGGATGVTFENTVIDIEMDPREELLPPYHGLYYIMEVGY